MELLDCLRERLPPTVGAAERRQLTLAALARRIRGLKLALAEAALAEWLAGAPGGEAAALRQEHDRCYGAWQSLDAAAPEEEERP